MRRRSWGVLVGAAVVAMVVGAPGAGSAAPVEAVQVPASAFADGFRIEAKATYQLDPPAGVVHVAVDATLTNQKPDQVSGGFVRQFYLPEFGVPVLSEATALRATKSDGTVLPVRLDGTESPRFSFAVVDLQPDLFHPSTQTIQLTYDLPRQAPRSDAFTRLNDAYATFPMLAIGDGGISAVEVVVPDGFEVELVGDPMQESEGEGQQVFTATGIADPLAWNVLVSARDDSKLIERVVDLGDQEVRVLGWPDDPEWAEFAERQVADGVPAMAELLDLDWPAERTIDVVETSSPYLYGYAGWYRPVESLIEVGDELDQHVMLHELAHLWFNDDLFAGRWINEGLAEVFSWQAVDALGGEVEDPGAVDAGSTGALRLNVWGEPDLQGGDTEAQEAFGYNASWAVFHRVVEEIGLESLAAVVRAADGHDLPYAAESVDSTLLRDPDWRTLLDLLEEVAGSETAEQVFRDLVVSPEQAVTLDERAEVRADYAALVESAEGWAPPAEVRLLMAQWDFDGVVELEPEVTEVIEAIAELTEVLDDVHAEVPEPLQVSYESARQVDDAAAVVADALGAARDLRGAQQDRDDGGGPLAAVGLLLSDVDEDLDAAHDAMQAGDYDAAGQHARDVQDELDGAATAGSVRLGALALVLVMGLLLVARLRRRRRQRTPDDSEPDGAERVGGPPDDGSQLGV